MTKETGCKSLVNNWHISIKYKQSNNITDNVTTKEISRNDRKLLQRTKKKKTSGNQQKLKELLKCRVRQR